ncbi:MAG: DUF6562 domain-containing protein [Alistipes sp.]
MYKHLLMSVVAASALVLTTSCSKSSEPVQVVGDTAQVSFILKADSALKARAISDGQLTDQLVYRVLDENGAVITGLDKVAESGLDLLAGHTVRLTLAKGQNYKVAFWAQNSACTAYTVNDNMTVSINYDGANNDETRDAFFKTIDLHVTGDMTESVVLKRPFAQVNVGCTVADWGAAVASGITVASSEVTIVDAANVLNLVDGTVSGAVTVNYTAAAIPAETLKVDTNNDGVKEDYHYLSMSYILPNDATTGAERTVASTSFVFHTNGGDIALADGLQNIPVQRNYRTNIVGTFLTSEVSVSVVVDPAYEDEYVVGPVYIGSQSYATIQDAIDAAAEGAVIDVTPDTYNEVLNVVGVANNITIQSLASSRATDEVVIAGVNSQRNGENLPAVTFKDITIDNSLADGNWFTGTGPCAPCVGAWGGNLNFDNVKFVVAGTSGKETGVMSWWTTSICTMNFKDCVFVGKNDHAEARAMQIYGHYNVNAEGCQFLTHKRYSLKYAALDGCVGTFKNNVVKNAKKDEANGWFIEIGSDVYPGANYTINLEGNELHQVNLYKEGYTNAVTAEHVTIAETGNTIYLADGFSLLNGVYSISNANGLFAFAKSVNEDHNNYSGKTIKLIADIDLENALWEPVGQTGVTTFNGTFDGDNHTISNLKVVSTSDNNYYVSGLFGWLNVATVKNVKVVGANISAHSYTGVIAGYMEAPADIYTCTIDNCHVENATVDSTVNGGAKGAKVGGIVGYVNPGAYLTVSNCTVKNSVISAGRDAGQVIGCAYASNTITGCTAESVTVSSNGTSTGENIREEVIGRYIE